MAVSALRAVLSGRDAVSGVAVRPWSPGFLPPERAAFGSNFPLFSFDAALLKMQESGLAEVAKKMLFEGTARRILPI